MAPPKKGGGLNLGPAPAPPTSTKNLTTGAAFNAFINAHPSMRGYSDQIYKWATKVYGVDPVVMAALFWRESFAAAKASGQDPETITSPTGKGVGIGQINPIHVGEKTPWGHIVSQADLVNPAFNIRWSTWYFSQQVAKYGNYDEAYAGQVGTQSGGYNHGYTGPALTSLLPARYVPKSGLSPTDKGTVAAETAAATATAKTQTTDKWAVLAKGQVKFVDIADVTQPPPNVLKYAGTPLTRSTFTQTWGQTYADTFEAYTGRKASGKELAAILEQAPSVYTLSNQLAQQGGFSKSPVYKQHAPGLVAIAQSILGSNWKPSGGIIRNAIAGNWDQATFEAEVRKQPAYQNGPEFKTNLAQNQAQAESIYGKPDASAMKLVKDVTAAGWSPTQFATWLRAQDAYKQTPEYQGRVLDLLGPNGLGLITGAVPTLSAAQVDQTLTAQDNLTDPATASATPVTPAVKKPNPQAAPELVSEHGMWGPQ